LIRRLVLPHQLLRQTIFKYSVPDIVDLDLRRLARAIASLPGRQHGVLRLTRIDEFRPQGIASTVGSRTLLRHGTGARLAVDHAIRAAPQTQELMILAGAADHHPIDRGEIGLREHNFDIQASVSWSKGQ
jgi:hypothetical protein